MTRVALLKKLDAVMAEAERTAMYGQITLDIRAGEAVMLRKATTEPLGMEKNSNANHFNR
jgi:hypothetical protein